MSYAEDWLDRARCVATFVDRILKGAQPADPLVERPMKFELVINLKTAKELSLAIPPTFLFQANEVSRRACQLPDAAALGGYTKIDFETCNHLCAFQHRARRL